MASLHEAFLQLSTEIPIDSAIQKRLERAYNIALNHPIGYEYTTAYDGSYVVSRASTSAVDTTPIVYIINEEGCSCPDAEKVRSGLCKHYLALRLLQICGVIKDTAQERGC